jgi:phosphoenolpyruvate carboxykinase (ATP)
MVAKSGTLATWNEPESTGRSPKDTVIVKRPQSQIHIDWNSPNNLPVTEEVFAEIFQDALDMMGKRSRIYVNDRVIGADSEYALPVKVITSEALTSVFVDNMFRPIPEDLNKSCFSDKPFFLIALHFR